MNPQAWMLMGIIAGHGIRQYEGVPVAHEGQEELEAAWLPATQQV